jgi:hypothetical protein
MIHVRVRTLRTCNASPWLDREEPVRPGFPTNFHDGQAFPSCISTISIGVRVGWKPRATNGESLCKND